MKPENPSNKNLLPSYTLAEAVALADSALLCLDTPGRFIWCNKAFTRLTGYALKDIRGKELVNLLHGPSTSRETLNHIRHNIKLGEDFRAELLQYHSTGYSYWVELAAHGLRSTTGSLEGYIISLTDISDRLAEHERRAYSEALLEEAEALACLGHWRFNIATGSIRCSKAACHILGLDIKAQSFSFEDFLNCFNAPNRKELTQAIEHCIATGSSFQKSLCRACDNGEILHLEARGRPETNAYGVTHQVFGTLVDISRTRRAQIALEESQIELAHARDLALESTKAKSEFLAMMSHEIRTPMNGVIGFARLLAGSPLDNEQQQYVETIISSADLLVEMIDQLLDLSKIESGKLELHPSPFSLYDLVQQVTQLFQPAAREKHLPLQCYIDEHLPDALYGDSGRIRQVLVNLIGNALKFTAKGRISIRLEATEAQDNPPPPKQHNAPVWIRFTVEDTGIGIPAERLEAIFQPFTQADSSISHKHGGTGLGLTVSQRLVDIMGGSIHAQSVEGKGSTFQFALPLMPACWEVARSAAPTSDDCLRLLREKITPDTPVLVVDDNSTNLQVSSLFLKRWGFEVDGANNGKQACLQLQNKKYAMIFLDIQMPEMNGYEVAQALKSGVLGEANRQTPIIAITAAATEQDEQRCLAAGMNGFVRKPLREQGLAAIVLKALSQEK